MNKKSCIIAILLIFVLSSCYSSYNQPAYSGTPTYTTTTSLPKLTNSITTKAPTLTSTLRQVTQTSTPIPHIYPTHTISPTSTLGPLDVKIDWQIPARIEIMATSFIDMKNGWALYDYLYLFKTNDGGESWIKLPRLKQAFNQIEFVSVKRGWAIAEDGLYISDDGGQSWDRLFAADFPFNHVRPGMDFVNETTGFLTMKTGLNRTRDGGKTWQALHPEAFADLTGEAWGLSSISFMNETEGWALYRTYNGHGPNLLKLFKTEDGGETFGLVGEAGPNIKNSIMNFWDPGDELFFLDGNHGWFVGSRYSSQKTEDSGGIWKSMEVSSNLTVFDLHMFTPDYGIASVWPERDAMYRGVMKTQDGGKTWEPLLPSLQPNQLVFFLDGEHGFGVSQFPDPATVLTTNNGGQSWRKIGNLPKPVYQLQFHDQKIGWAAVSAYEDKQGYLWQTNDGGMTWHEIHLPSGFLLENFHFSTADDGIAWDADKNAIQTLNGGKSWLKLNPLKLALPLPEKDCQWTRTATEIYHACAGETGWKSVMSLNTIYRLIPVSGTSAWVFGQNEKNGPMILLRTTDSGKTWEPQKTRQAAFQDITFIDQDRGWAISSMFVVKTTDGANSWQQMPPAVITTK